MTANSSDFFAQDYLVSFQHCQVVTVPNCELQLLLVCRVSLVKR